MQEALIADMFSKGCVEQRNAVITYYVFLDLIEVKRFYDVKYQYLETLQTMYLDARIKKTATERTIFVPVSSVENISFNNMDSYLEKFGVKSLQLVFVSPDSTLVYYQISDGLAPVPEMIWKTSKKNSKKLLFEKQFRNRQEEIKEQAVPMITNTNTKRQKRRKNERQKKKNAKKFKKE